MAKKNHSRRRHKRSQRGGDLFGSTSTPTQQYTPASSGSSSGWFSGLGNKAKGLTSSVSNWFTSSSPSTAPTASGYSQPQQPQYSQQGQYAGRRKRYTRRVGRRSGKSKKRRGDI